jgi:hypothetical protein
VNRSLLGKVRLWTVVAGLVAGAVAWPLAGSRFAVGVAATAIWAVVGFWALEGLLRAALVPPGETRNGALILFWAAVKLAVYAVAVWVLLSRPFPPVSHIVGMSLLLIVLVAQGALVRPRPGEQPVRRGDDE